MDISYSALSVANYFIKKASDEEENITLMKLSKLVYIAHGWYLANFHTPLISEPIQAWQYGPVIESIYHEFKKYGNTHIDMMAIASEINDEKTLELLEKVWEVNKKHTAIQLSNWTHIKGSPWELVYDKHIRNQIIPNSVIEEYFSKLIENNHDH